VSVLILVISVIRHSVGGPVLEDIVAYILVSGLMPVKYVIRPSVKRSIYGNIKAHTAGISHIGVMCVIRDLL
jgi:hypothetical protein